MLDQVKQFVATAFQADKNGEGLQHFERTVYWAQQLRPDADEPILIAAYAHDLERAVRAASSADTFKDRAWDDPALLVKHQEGGAAMIREFLQQKSYDPATTARVYNMVRHHEEGGDSESDLIKDADSLSYLETNAHLHIKNLAAKLGNAKVRAKIDWMFRRISSPQAKKLARPLYDQAIANLLGHT